MSEPQYDYCDKFGANLLKQRIETYWRERGHEIQVVLQEVGFLSTMRSARFDVRSTLVNGLPQTAALPSQQSNAA